MALSVSTPKHLHKIGFLKNLTNDKGLVVFHIILYTPLFSDGFLKRVLNFFALGYSYQEYIVQSLKIHSCMCYNQKKNKNMQLLKKKRVLKSRTVIIHVVVEFSINVRITEIILISMCLRY